MSAFVTVYSCCHIDESADNCYSSCQKVACKIPVRAAHCSASESSAPKLTIHYAYVSQLIFKISTLSPSPGLKRQLRAVHKNSMATTVCKTVLNLFSSTSKLFLRPLTRMWGTSPTNRGSGAIPWKNFDNLNAGSKVCHWEHCKFWPDSQPKARLERLYSVCIFVITLTYNIVEFLVITINQ